MGMDIFHMISVSKFGFAMLEVFLGSLQTFTNNANK